MPRGIRTELEVGAVYGKLRVLGFSHSDGALWWRFLCEECGSETVLRGAAVTGGHYKSCGCWRGATHGMVRSPTFRSWSHMRQRCMNPSDKGFPKYGGRGIQVCDRWQESFENFLADMGAKPPGHTLDRIDNDGDYTPDNCRWATPRQQANNTRRNRLLAIDGEVKTAAQWARVSGVTSGAIRARLKSGWPIRDAVFTPTRKHRLAHVQASRKS